MIRILYIDAATNQVEISKEGMQIPEFEELYSGDKTAGKTWFKAVISFVFYVYAKGDQGSPFQTQPFSQRCTLACYEKYVGHKREPDEFLKHSKVKSAIKAFNKYTKTQTELFEERLYEDMEKTIQYLNNIPMSKSTMIDVEVNVGTDKDPVLEKRKVKVDFNNSKEKIEAYKSIKEILMLKKEYERMIHEETAKKIKSTEYLFEEQSQR